MAKSCLMSAIAVECLLTWTNRTRIGVAHHVTALIFYNITRCYGKHVAVFAVAVAAGDIIKYQSFVYGSFVWGIHVRYNNKKICYGHQKQYSWHWFPLIKRRIFYVWFESLHPINNLSVLKGWVFLGWTSTKLGLMCLAQGHNAVTPVRLEPTAPWSRV